MTHLKLRDGDKAFMLDVISTLTSGNHIYFNKDYVPPKRVSTATPDVNIDNSDNFFTGLPPTKYNGKSKSRHLNLFISE